MIFASLFKAHRQTHEMTGLQAGFEKPFPVSVIFWYPGSGTPVPFPVFCHFLKKEKKQDLVHIIEVKVQLYSWYNYLSLFLNGTKILTTFPRTLVSLH